jgi:hypothetical protein
VPEYTSMSTDVIRRRWASSGRTVGLFRINMKESKISDVASGHTTDDDDSLLSRRSCLYVPQSVLTLGFYGHRRVILFLYIDIGISPRPTHIYFHNIYPLPTHLAAGIA